MLPFTLEFSKKDFEILEGNSIFKLAAYSAIKEN
jgi:hypothetical protein